LPTRAEYIALLTTSTETCGASGNINGLTVTSTNGTLFFPAGGWNYGSISANQTTHGYYWTSEQYTATQAYILHFHSTDPGTATYATKFDALPVRCVRPYTAPPVVNPVGEVLVEGTTVNSRAVYWAKTNVGSTAKTFESSATAYGGYYLWDDDTPYTYTGGTNPPDTYSTATYWQSANNPCPAGWELPTYQDCVDLVAASTTKTWGASGGINGVTYTSPKGTLFFPAAGQRVGSTSLNQTIYGFYWSFEQSGATTAHSLSFNSAAPSDANSAGNKFDARSVRCIRLKLE
jgi:uncharacterized protein (TIGR02145 family)